MRTRFKQIIAGLCIAVMAFSLTACSSTGSENSEVSSNTQQTTLAKNEYSVPSLKLAAGGDRGAPNPFLQKSGGPADQKVRLIFDSLLNEGEKEMEPWLAKEWSVNGNTYTFILNENALWHDGEKVTADDVVFTINYYKEHNPMPQLIVSGDYSGLSATAKDEYTVDITVSQNDATVLEFIGSLYILPEHIWKDVSDPKTFTDPEAFIGCGMYKYKSYDSATGAYSYIAFDDYYGPKVAAKEVQFVPVSDSLLAFENGEIDLVEMPVDAKEKYENDPSLGFINKEDDMIYKLVFNMEKVPELKDAEVRKAIYQAIDCQAIVDNVLRGYGTAGEAGDVSPNNRFYTSNIQSYEYDPEAAKSVLDGKNISFTLTVPGSTLYTDMAEMIKMDLAAVGVTMQVESGVTGYLDKASKGELEAVMIGHGMAGRTPEYLRTSLATKYKNTTSGHAYIGPIGWSNEEFDTLAEQNLLELDADKRKELFQEMQTIISEEVPVITLATHTYVYMFRKDYYDGWAKSFDYEQFDYCRVSYLDKNQ